MTLCFHAGGGGPPRSDEELLVEPDGHATYRTAVPWPAQPPFEEAGIYADLIGPPAAARLHQLARAALADRPPPPQDPGTCVESVRIDGPRVRWDPDHRPPVSAAAREVVAHLRRHPVAAVRAARPAPDRLELSNPGREPVRLGGGEAWAGDGLPAALVTGEAIRLDLPAALGPGEAVRLDLLAALGSDEAVRLDLLAALGPGEVDGVAAPAGARALVHVVLGLPEGETLDAWLYLG